MRGRRGRSVGVVMTAEEGEEVGLMLMRKTCDRVAGVMWLLRSGSSGRRRRWLLLQLQLLMMRTVMAVVLLTLTRVLCV